MPLKPTDQLLQEFHAAMEGIGNFELQPTLCIAVSGGSDSLALALLAHAWAQAKGGRITAVTVDHGLKPGSADEASAASEALAPFGIEHVTLQWTGMKPATGIQAAARAARYDLLAGWCRDNQVLHLATAHQHGDQLETHLMRKARASGTLGLAAMGAKRLLPGLRLLRPLLAIERSALREFLLSKNVPWHEDPSNIDARFKRTELRQSLEAYTEADRQALSGEIDGYKAIRADLAERVANVLGDAAILKSGAYALLLPDVLRTADPDVAIYALRALTLMIGGNEFSPGYDRLKALLNRLARDDFRGATLGGVAFRPSGHVGGAHALLVAREPRGLPGPLALTREIDLLWDGRFRVTTSDQSGELALRPLLEAGWRQVGKELKATIPHFAALTQPAVWRNGTVLAVPNLAGMCNSRDISNLSISFEPRHTLDAT